MILRRVLEVINTSNIVFLTTLSDLSHRTYLLIMIAEIAFERKLVLVINIKAFEEIDPARGTARQEYHRSQ